LSCGKTAAEGFRRPVLGLKIPFKKCEKVKFYLTDSLPGLLIFVDFVIFCEFLVIFIDFCTF
jgi:hypothetical protein